jgi:D-beta-D-heptose 7-phosphate kinase/D-beta-D-heptose 1-phosphate adenosyltransferase
VNSFLKIIENFPEKKILVVGDFLLDQFIWGNVSRISPEAPIPVVEVIKESFMPGGAGNVANNLVTLGAKVFLSGVIGQDGYGGILLKLLKEKKVNVEGLMRDPSRPTTLKTRIIAHHQQVVRVDKEKKDHLSPSLSRKMVEYIAAILKEVEAVIIADYAKGVISKKLLQKISLLNQPFQKIIAVDPKPLHTNYYRQVDLITPNQSEAEQMSGVKIENKSKLIRAGKKLLKKTGAKSVLITRGAAGMTLFEVEKEPVFIPTVAREVYDVSGAGDTVIALFVLALLAGANKTQAAYLANIGAGVVVGKLGVATVSIKEMKKFIEQKVDSGNIGLLLN